MEINSSPLKINDECPYQSYNTTIIFLGLTAAAAIVSLCILKCFSRRKFSPTIPYLSSAKHATNSKSGAVAYIGKGRDRLSVELCQTCIESNKMLSQFAAVTGSKFETFEPCDLCK